MPVVQAEVLHQFAVDLLQAGGFTPNDAEQTATLLVWANLRGIDSHGVLRIPRYIEMVELGLIKSGHAPELVRSMGAIAVLDGGKCPGAVGMNAAVAKAAELARLHGLGWCAARSISHAGAVGYFTSQLAERGLVGIAITASKPLMSYFGARGEALSTNPISIAFPRKGHAPIVLDMSTSAVAIGKIMAAQDAGRPIPNDWAIDASGKPTTNPAEVAALLPMAGAKGSGLSLMIEMLTSVLVGNAVIGPVLTGIKKGGFNGTVIAVNPDAFGERPAFETEVERLSGAIKGLQPAEGTQAVLLPGERGAEEAQKRLAGGIPVSAGTMKRLLEQAAALKMAVPSTIADLVG
ncbi:Ldh family oxidoreductase [Rhizobium sp. FKY42]|uniref:Ldh family oxidoreductase n=1 Tax=Rhizobium sp. FKY42 TaxID=2562310 RepID=UPI0010C0E54C|nr:Ldh family oxidoreductase [Rhizobium sp. FKY42]